MTEPSVAVAHHGRRYGFVLLATATLLATACGSSSTTPADGAPTTAAPRPISTVTATTATSVAGSIATSSPTTSAPPNSGPRTTTLTEHDGGRAVVLHVGDRLRVVLVSTYWGFQPDSDPTVLHADGEPTVIPQMDGCVPGQGCGTVTAEFTAAATGHANVTATRTSCGEAMACTPANGHFQVSITVM